MSVQSVIYVYIIYYIYMYILYIYVHIILYIYILQKIMTLSSVTISDKIQYDLTALPFFSKRKSHRLVHHWEGPLVELQESEIAESTEEVSTNGDE